MKVLKELRKSNGTALNVLSGKCAISEKNWTDTNINSLKDPARGFLVRFDQLRIFLSGIL